MARPKKKTEFDIEINKNWLSFSDELMKVFEACDYSRVFMPFECAIGKANYTFTEHEVVYVSDVVVVDNKLAFKVPFARNHKIFTYETADCIIIQNGTSETPLNGIVDEIFAKHFPTVENVKAFEEACSKVKGAGDLLNRSEDIIEEHSLKVKAIERYSKIPNYGIF